MAVSTFRSQLNLSLGLDDRIRLDIYCEERKVSKAELIGGFISTLAVDKNRINARIEEYMKEIKSST